MNNAVLVREGSAIILAGSNDIELYELQVTDTKVIENEPLAIAEEKKTLRYQHTRTFGTVAETYVIARKYRQDGWEVELWGSKTVNAIKHYPIGQEIKEIDF